MNIEEERLKDEAWRKWGPYLSERQWGTVREDYSPDGDAWRYFPHDHARSRAYRWGEDGIAGISDQMQRICFAITLWNGKDPILKERLFGLSGPEGNHGEDVKELYYYLDNTPSHSYMKHLYKYPQAAFPYDDLLKTNQSRTKEEGEYELLDTGIFDEGNYFDVFTEYAKNDPEDLLIRITIHNRSSDPAPLSILPTLWLRNRWSFGLTQHKPIITLLNEVHDHGVVKVDVHNQDSHYLYFENPDQLLFTENETNTERLYNVTNSSPFVKDSFHHAVINNEFEIFYDKTSGTKFSPLYQTNIAGNSTYAISLRLTNKQLEKPFENFDEIFDARIKEADDFYRDITDVTDEDLLNIQRQAFAGMLWNKQFYRLDIPRWLAGDVGQPTPPESRYHGRNSDWETLNNEDIISMPDKWEFPWYASWDLGFHCVALSMIDPAFAKHQLILFLREWYMKPNGQLPAYEWSFSDVNPPVHAWSCLQVYKIDRQKTGSGDIRFLKKVFSKLLINFTWWVNRKDFKGKNVFEGGFLGLDNIGVFDRSNMKLSGGSLEQADGTSWMALYCLNMLEMALEIAQVDDTYEDVTTKFLEHFVYISESLNRIGEDWIGSWDNEEGFFYDVLILGDGRSIPIKIRSLVGLTAMFAVLILKKEMLEKLPDFYTRLKWFQRYREKNKQYQVLEDINETEDLLLSLVPKERLQKLLHALLDENEFLSPGGIRSISKIHQQGYNLTIDNQKFYLEYEPAESRTGLFGGNSNWRGPVWMPMNYLIIQALKTLSDYHQLNLSVELPTGSGNRLSLEAVYRDLTARLINIFKQDASGKRPVHGGQSIYQQNPDFKELLLFYEYFNGDNAAGLGASHQTGWTGLVATLINDTSSNQNKAT